MADKKLIGRIVHKHDIQANWEKATNFVPMKGELIVYDIDDTHDYERIKIGDGKTLVSELPFVDDVLREYIDALNALVGETPVSTQISDAIVTKADISNGQYAVTASSSDGIAYTATVPGITALSVGASFIMIPGRVSAGTTPTLNVNGLGAKNIRRRLSNMSTSVQAGYTANWLAANNPFRVMYDGAQWIVEGLTKPAAADLYGPVPKATADAEGNVISDTYVTKAELEAILTRSTVRLSEVNLLSSKWIGSAKLYAQVVAIDGITEYSQVDLKPSIEQLAIFHNKDIAFVTENEDGVVTVYVLGDKPADDYTIQVSITEVSV
jgi:hypothetical protein